MFGKMNKEINPISVYEITNKNKFEAKMRFNFVLEVLSHLAL